MADPGWSSKWLPTIMAALLVLMAVAEAAFLIVEPLPVRESAGTLAVSALAILAAWQWATTPAPERAQANRWILLLGMIVLIAFALL